MKAVMLLPAGSRVRWSVAPEKSSFLKGDNMVVMTAPTLHRGREAVLGTANELPRLSRIGHQRSAGSSVFLPPEGFIVCRRCTELVDLSKMIGGIAACPNGHAFDLEAEAARINPNPNFVPPHSGLTPTRMGQLAEKIVFDLGDLGEHGRIVGELDSKPYHGVFDFVTDTGNAGEIKSSDADARCQVFDLAGYREAKNAALEAEGHKAATMVHVRVDFRTMTAALRIRTAPQFKYWSVAKKDEPFKVVTFELPPDVEAVVGGADRAQELLPAASTPDKIPF